MATIVPALLCLNLQERIDGDLNVLAATWNVGNAIPPPPEVLLNSWLKGADE